MTKCNRFKRSNISFIILIILTVNSLLIFTQFASSSTATVKRVSDILDGNTNDIFIVGSAAYVACGWGGLKIYDISNPNSVTLEGELDGIGDITSISIKDTYAYLAAGVEGLKVVDIGDVANLSVKGSLEEPGDDHYATEVEIVGNYAIYADMDDGLKIIDITNPLNPTKLNDYDHVNFNTADIAINDTYVYVSNLDLNRIEVLDLSNIYIPTMIGYYQDAVNGPSDIKVVGDLVYVADAEDGLEIINASNPSNLKEIGNYTTEHAFSVYVNGSYAYLSSSSGFEILNISDPTNPTQISTFEGNAGELFFKDPFLYLVDPWHDGIKIVDVSDPSNPEILGIINNEMYVVDLSIFEGTMYCAGSDGVVSVDILNPETPIVKGNISGLEWTYSVDSDSDYIYTHNGSEFQVYTRSTMTKIGNYNYTTDIVYVRVEGSIGYIGANDGTYSSYAVLDLSTPSNPIFLADYVFTDSSIQLVDGVVRDDLLLLLSTDPYTQNSLLIPIDMRIPGLPTEITRVPVGYGCRHICVEGDYAYVTSFYQGIKIIDITSPGAPMLVSEYTYPLSVNPYDFYSDIFIKNDFLYVGIYPGIMILDVYDKSNPEMVTWMEDETIPELVVVSGNYIYFSNGQDGVEILEVDIQPGRRSNIPGYSIVLIIPISIVVILILIKNKKKK